jgi:PhnB protein
MQFNAYLMFSGQCQEAFQFYGQLLGGQIAAMFSHVGTPAEQSVPPEWRDKIMHARLQVGDNVLMGMDAPPERYTEPKGFFVQLAVPDQAEAERIFHALAENGTVRMPLQQTFWAARFGMLVDRFGIPWMVNCDLAAAGKE